MPLSFKKSLNRTGTTVRVASQALQNTQAHCNITDEQLMQKTGQMERTVDTEFQDETTKFKT